MEKIPLVLMFGPQASGKSSFIKMNNLENYTISADKIRINLNGFMISDGHKQIKFNPDSEPVVWQIFDLMLKTRLAQGLPTVVDNTNLGGGRVNPMQAILDLVPDNYQVYLVDCFEPLLDRDAPLSEASLARALRILSKRNRDREYSVDLAIIERFVDYYAQFELPAGVIKLSSSDAEQLQDLIGQIIQ
ncbi:ATP-binding protein [Lactobacillus gigeriorum]|uniref:Uncharacterized protein n=1 Tax=Lactobacillus gigeriorum DSM 23908 = CRBIP 24.85 TaxID=1423751 RepID=I7LGK7_9LACO|nr:ATP-binding protein [Lactobacillus gigeriorum]KRN09183.1 hypothetical protein FC38_GL001538 [Lactobacillus gigeriorum DSM 23908 = CRBIP 24.85]CCI87733.1 Putative uncharacterized protein [Lactobacillus gigeriorum DSM 23908 = CRBIP 24.85]